jgi:hypothetical protein
MTLLQWLGDSYTPRRPGENRPGPSEDMFYEHDGPIGDLEAVGPERFDQPRWAVLVEFTLAMAALVGECYLLGKYASPLDAPKLVLAASLTLVYLIIAFFIAPRPNFRNLGWLGGWVDNPFQYSDNLNRGLLWLKLVLLPGRLIAGAFVDMAILVWRANDSSAPDTPGHRLTQDF